MTVHPLWINENKAPLPELFPAGSLILLMSMFPDTRLGQKFV